MPNRPSVSTPRLLILAAALLALTACGGAAATQAPTPATTGQATATPEATEAASGGSAAKITIDNAADLRQVFLVPVSKTTLMAASFSGASHDIATFGFDKVVRTFDGDTGDLKKEMTGNSEYSRGLAFSPDGTKIASGGAYYVWLFEAATGKTIASTQVDTKVWGLAWSPDGKTIAVIGDRSAAVQLLDGKTGRVTNQLFNPTNYTMSAIAYAPDQKLIAVGDGRGRVTVFDPESSQVMFDDRNHRTGAVSNVSFSPDGAYVGVCHAGSGDIEVWETKDWSLMFSKAQAHPGGCGGGAFSADGKVYFTGGDDGKFVAWKVQDGEIMNTIKEAQAIWSVSLSGDGSLLAVAVDSGRMGIITVP